MIQANVFLESLAGLQKENDCETVRTALLELKDLMIHQKLADLASSEVRKIMKGFWEFILFASQQPFSSVKLATMRATVLFLHRLYYFYPKEISSTFEEVSVASTVDLQPSLLMAGVFGILSYFRAPCLCDEFQASCPVFHHFGKQANCDPDMVAGIIGLYSHLGKEFHENMIDLFLSQIEKQSNKAAERAIPILSRQAKLGRSTLEKLKRMADKWHCLVVASEILKQAPASMVTTLDITVFLEESLKVVSCEKDVSASYLDAAFSILAIENLQNSLVVEVVGQTGLKLTYEDEVFELNLQKFIGRPSFYQLNLPLEMMFPNPTDGATLMTAKFAGMIRNLPKCKSQESLDQMLHFLSHEATCEYDPRQSSLMQGIFIAAPKIMDENLLKSLFAAIRPLLFRKSVSWFHDKDKLSVISAFPGVVLEGKENEPVKKEILVRLIRFICHENDRLSVDAQKVMVDSLMTQENCVNLTYKLSRKCDLFSPLSFRRTLEIFVKIGKKFGENVIPKFFVHEVIELFDFYSNDYVIFVRMCAFLAMFRGNVIPNSIITRCISAVIATYEAVSGEKWPKPPKLNQSIIEEGQKIVEASLYDYISDFTDPKFDKTGENTVAAAAISLLSVCQSFPDDLLWPTIQCCIHIYPTATTRFVSKHWKFLSTARQVEFLTSYYETLPYVHGYKPLQTWLRMYLTCCKGEHAQKLVSCQRFLRRYIRTSLSKGGDDLSIRLLQSYIKFYKVAVQHKDFAYDLLSEETKRRLESAKVPRPKPRNHNSLPTTLRLTVSSMFRKNEIWKNSDSNPDTCYSFVRTSEIDVRTMIDQALSASEYAKVRNLLIFAADCHMVIFIDDLDWPITLVDAAATYLKLTDPDRYESFCLKHRPLTMERVLEHDKPKKKELIAFCTWLNIEEQLSEDDALKTIVCASGKLQNCICRNRRILLLTLAALCAKMCRVIPYSVAATVIKTLKDAPHLPKYWLSRFLAEFCKKVERTGRPKLFLGSLKDRFASRMYLNTYYLVAKLQSHMSLSDADSATKVIAPVFQTGIPSFYCSGLRALSTAVRIPKYGNPCLAIRQLLQHMLSLANTFGRNPMIHDQFGRTLLRIFRTSACAPVIQSICNHQAEILPRCNASFYSYAAVIPCFSPVSEKNAHRLNCPGFQQYHMLMIETLAKTRDAPYALLQFQKWRKHISRFDNQALAESLQRWLEFLSSRLDIKDILAELGQIPRFLPVFVALQKFISVKGIKIDNAAELMHDTSPVHIRAFSSASSGNLQLALKFAMFDQDCDQSQALISHEVQ